MIVTIIILTCFGLATFAFLAAKAFPKDYERQSVGRPHGRALVVVPGRRRRLRAPFVVRRRALAIRLRELGLG